ncbi:hypothetical protein N9052_02040 [bacterium]|nr:hypothetical protein [bacterium]
MAQQVQSSVLPSIADLVGVFCNDLEHLSEVVVLVLDDYHLLAASAVQDFIDLVFRRPPRNLHVVVLARRDPSLPLQNLRAAGLLTEIRMSELAFTLTESREFMPGIRRAEISEQAISRLHERTEGWPVALRLAVLAAPDSGSAEDFAKSIPEDIRSIREYLLLEVLAKRSPEVRRGLLRTAFLDRFSAKLCEAVLSDSQSKIESQSADAFMTEVHESGLFVIALDNRQEGAGRAGDESGGPRVSAPRCRRRRRLFCELLGVGDRGLRVLAGVPDRPVPICR